MVWAEFWNEVFTKVLQYGIVAILITLNVVIFFLICIGGAFGLEYLSNKYVQAEIKEYLKKRMEENGTSDISNREEGETKSDR